jgi:hypothetical protein
MRYCLALALLLFSGCSLLDENAPSDIDFEVERAAYEAGDAVELVLLNRTEGEVGYNLSCSALERRVGMKWINAYAGSEDGRICLTYLQLLAADTAALYDYPLESWFPSGRYRFKTSVEDTRTGERYALTSPTFKIAAP